ncbi:MAG: hypothetical protein WC508_05395 [Patescibacteria group bacterium]
MLRKQKINESEIMKFGFLGGIAQATYCLLVVVVISILDKVMPTPPIQIAGFMLVLLLFVFSAAVSGILVFGYPAYLATQNRFIEALMTALTTLATLAIIGILSFILLSFI